MPETAVSDTGPILHLTEIAQVSQLRLFEEVIVSDQVKTELTHSHAWQQAEDELPGCLRVEAVQPRDINEQAKLLSSFTVHRADLSVASLASRMHPDVVLTDDLRLRKGLESLGYQVAGSVAVLIRAFRIGRLSKPDLLSRLDQLFDGSTLYTSKAFRETVRSALNDFPG